MGFMDKIRASFASDKESPDAVPPALPRSRAPRPTERSIRGRFIVEDRVSQVRRDSVEERELRSRDAGAAATLYNSVTPAASHPEGSSHQRFALPAGLDRAALSPADQNRLREIVNGQRDGQHGSIGNRI